MASKIKKLVLKIFPKKVILILKGKYKRITSEDINKVKIKSAYNNLDLLDKISQRISIHDTMFKNNNGVHYLQVGLSAISCIEDAINKSNVKVIEKILDMPCGHGRVLRFIAKYFPNAELTAMDLDKYGVEFCYKEFGAIPVYSKPNLRDINLNKKFDFIWCGSLATHFDEDDILELFKFFYRHLNSEGLLVFSMHGRCAVDNLYNRKNTYGLDNNSIKQILLKINEHGFAYANYQGQSKYGISLATPKWIENKLNEVGKWRNFIVSESAWDAHHDIYSLIKI